MPPPSDPAFGGPKTSIPTFTYSQQTGALCVGGLYIGTGYSGRGDGLNNPAMQNVPLTGPLPVGFYTIGAAETHPLLGPVVMALTPDETDVMFGRSEFFIHGDNQAENHTGSEGCIVLPLNSRRWLAICISNLGWDRLEVTE